MKHLFQSRRALDLLPVASWSALTRTLLPLRLLVLLAVVLLVKPLGAQTIYLLTEDNRLATTSVSNPSATSALLTITNINAGETLVAIDVRPQNQQLYALGVDAANDTATLYHLSPETGFAAVVGAAPGLIALTTNGATVVDFPDPATVDWDIDFNPAADRLRVVAGGLNFRINPNTGLAVDGDNGGAVTGGINPDGPINGGTTNVNATAYTNSQPNNGNITTQYTVDATTNTLFIQNASNAGTQTLGQTITLNGSTLDFSEASFDIAPGVNAPASNNAVTTGSAFMVARVGGISNLYSLNLVNAQATNLGTVGLVVRCSAIRTELGAAIALNSSGDALIRFDPNTPSTTTTQALAVASLASGEVLVGVDGRPQTGQLMGLAVNATANTGTLYLIDPQNGVLTAIGTQGQIAFVAAGSAVDFPNPATTGYGFDFNPTNDRIRVVTGSGLNFRVNPNNGASVDGDLGGAAGSVAGVNTDGSVNGGGITGLDAVAYTNSFAQSLTGGVTTLFTLDSATNKLSIQTPPNAGTQTLSVPVTINGSTLDFTPQTTFDIPSSVAVGAVIPPARGEGWMIATVGGVTGEYRIDLPTGAATFFGNVGAGVTSVSSAVIWATVPEIDVEAPPGTVVQDNSGTVNFGGTVVGHPVVRSIKVTNRGSQDLRYTTSFTTGTAFSVTQGASGTIAGSTSALLEVTFPAASIGSANDTVHILSNDSNEASFEIALTAQAFVALTDDAVTVTAGPTRINPLANDDFSGTLTITATSEPSIVIAGRTLIIPDGFTGTFTYNVSNGTTTGQATVTVTAGTPFASPTTYNGLIFAADGDIVGWANAAISAKGMATVQLRGGANTVAAKITFPSGTPTGSVFTKLGNLTLTLNPSGTVTLSLAALGGNLTGNLRAARTIGNTVRKYHVALASVDPALPGGGYAVANVTARGGVTVVGLLPDGLPFSAATTLGDNGSFAFFAVAAKGKPPGLLGGELLTADLTATDVTGELLYAKLPQTKGALGLHLGGVDTVLTANGGIYAGTLPFTGLATLQLSGGNLAGTESAGVTVSTKGIPTIPTGSLKAWTGVAPKVGKFTVKVAVPVLPKPVTGSGLYIPKLNIAWGYFPGKTVGGRIQLSVP